jgi:hypothetical protein
VTIRGYIDWAKDGTFTGTFDEVSNDLRGTVSVSYGRDQATALSPLVAGRGSAQLDNSLRRYSPKNTGSVLTGLIKPARPVLFQRVIGGVTYTIFSGHTDRAPINPDVSAKRVGLSLVDWLADFRRPDLSTELYRGLRTGEIVGLILDEVGWTGGRDLDSGATIVPFWWAENVKAYDMLQQILASEGAPSLLTIDTSGGIVFRDRHHRLTRTASSTVQSTWRGTEFGPQPLMGLPFSADEAWQNVINDVSFTVDERQPEGALSVVWSTDETVFIPASSTVNFNVSTTDPFMDAVAPVEGIDFTLLAGGIASTGLSRTSGASAVLSITATASSTRLKGLQVRAFNVPVKRQVKVTASDATSITDYESQGLPSGSEPVWAGRWDAQSLADLYVLQRKQPLTLVTATFRLNRTTEAALAPLILGTDLSDRVRIIEPETQLAHDFFVERITHDVYGKEEHVVTFELEQAPAAPSNPFILNSSTLNGAATLGY